MKKLFALLALAGLAVTPVSLASVENVGTYNLILKDDLTTSSDIEGQILIGGNISMSGLSLDVGSEIPADPLVDAVTVVGDITANDFKTQNGNIVYGGDAGSTTLMNNGSGTAQQASQGLLQNTFDEVWLSVLSDSEYYQSLDSNGTFDTADMNNKTFESSSTDDLLVFDVAGSDLLSGSFSFDFAPTIPIVINVSGTETLNINAKAVGNFTKQVASLVLWNFYDYTALNFNGDGWNGSVLAPNADITSYTGSLDGGFAALSYTGGVELHNELFDYEPPSSSTEPVPAPPALLLLMGSVFIVLCLKRR